MKRFDVPDQLVRAIRIKKWTPFVGAGLSKQADSNFFPTWNELLLRMITRFDRDGYLRKEWDPKGKEVKQLRTQVRANQTMMVADSLKARVPLDVYQDFLLKQFDVRVKPSHAHELLFKLKPECIITTNYDCLLESAYAALYHAPVAKVLYDQPGQVRNRLKDRETFVFKIHGCISNPSNIILSLNDYERLKQIEEGYKAVLASVFVYTTVLFIGFSLSDPELLEHLERIRFALHKEGQPHFALLPESSFTEQDKSEFHNRFGVQVIPYRSNSRHTGVVHFLKQLDKLARKRR